MDYFIHVNGRLVKLEGERRGPGPIFWGFVALLLGGLAVMGGAFL